MKFSSSSYLFIFLFLAVFSGGCNRQPVSTADVPRIISQNHKIAVLPFSQPLVPSQLITGQIPQPQGKIPPLALQTLDRDLRDALFAQGNRRFDFIPASQLPRTENVLSGQPAALHRWIAFGETRNLDYLLVPQVLNWQERIGSQAGVTESASIRLEFFLISIPQKILIGRSIYEEKQIGLIDNFLTVKDFIKRKGQWVEANALAREGIDRAIKDLGL